MKGKIPVQGTGLYQQKQNKTTFIFNTYLLQMSGQKTNLFVWIFLSYNQFEINSKQTIFCHFCSFNYHIDRS